MERKIENRIFLALGLYFLLHLAIRLLISPSLELDEAEQMILTQQISLGYGSQPPLYTWLQSALFHFFGGNIFSLALLKNLLLFFTYFFVYLASRNLGYNRVTSLAAMLSLFFIPQIAWESQRDLTHSVLATTLTAATIFCWIRLKRDQSISNYLLIGLCWGAGILAKYNYCFFLISLLAASLTIFEYRALILRSRILYAVASMVAVVSPHAVWAITHLPVVMASSGKFKQASRGSSYIASAWNGTTSLAQAALSFAGPLLIIYAFAWHRQRKQCHEKLYIPSQEHAAPNLLLRCILISLTICVMMVLLFQVTAFKDRWMQPILFFLPLALLPITAKALEYGNARLISLLAGLVAFIVLAGLALRAPLAPFTSCVTRFNLPYNELAAQLEGQVKPAELVITNSTLLAGNLILLYPQTRVTIPGGALLYHHLSPTRLLVVWEDTVAQKQSDKLWKLVETMMGDQKVVRLYQTIQAPFRYLPDRTMTFYSVMIERTTSATYSK